MKILVTGGAGFIGSHTVELLSSLSHQVVVYDNLSAGSLQNLNLQDKNIRVVEADILDFEILCKSMRDVDAVLHLAAISSVSLSIQDPIQSLETNTRGMVHVLEAIRKEQRSIRLVYASSAAVYGDVSQLPCDDREVLHTQPLSPYALEKKNNEHYAQLYKNLFNISSLGMRYFNVYGERQDPRSHYSGVISQFLNRYRSHKTLNVYGDGEQTRDFIYVKDIAKANVLALAGSYEGVLNIATGQPQTINQLIQCIELAGEQKAKIHFENARPGDIEHSYASIEKAAFNLNFRYSTNLQEGICLLMENYRHDDA